MQKHTRLQSTSLPKLGLFLAASLVSSGHLAATTLYSDSFSRTTGSGDGNGDPNGAAGNFSDWGTNDNGLGGSVSQAWIAGPSRDGGGRNAVTNGSQGINHGTSAFFNYDAAANSPGGFTVSLNFARFVNLPDPGPGGGGYIAFGFGVSAAAPINDFTAIGAADWSILFQQANNGNAANSSVFQDNSDIGNFDYLDPDGAHSLQLTFMPDVPGAYGDADTINVNVSVDGVISQNYSVLGGDNFGSFTVSANNFDTRYIDNLVVSSIPEPSSALLLVSGLGACLLRRRRP